MDCPDCGMGYCPDAPADRKEHSDYHDKVVHGLRIRPATSDQVIAAQSDCQILLVTQRSKLIQRDRVREIGTLANRETRFDGGVAAGLGAPDASDTHAYVLRRAVRAVGLLMIHRCSKIWRTSWAEYAQGKWKQLPEHPPTWSIAYIWIHREHRRRGYASALARTALKDLNCPLEAVGFYPPFTEAGEALARSLCPTTFLIAK